MSRMKLRGKRALVTAGAQGIGLSISRELAAAGCDVFVHYRSSRDAAETLCDELTATGVRAAGGTGDLTDAAECRRMVDEAASWLGGLDVLVNNARSLVAREVRRSRRRVLGRGHAVEPRQRSVGDPCHASAPGRSRRVTRRRQHREPVIGGRPPRRGTGAIAYSTAKGAMLTLTRGLASDYAPKGVRVNAVTPGLILGSAFHAQRTPEETQRKIIAGIPLGRAGTTEDVARAVVYLASEFDGFITGATLDINGGVYLV